MDSANAPKQILNTKASLSLENYAGTYEDELHGIVKITLVNDRLNVMVNNILPGDLSHYHYNTFKVAYHKKYYTPGYYTFQLGNSGKINAVIIHNITYKRK